MDEYDNHSHDELVALVRGLEAALRSKDSDLATTEALCMSHEGHIAKLEAALHERDTQCHTFSAQVIKLEAELEAERGRADIATANVMYGQKIEAELRENVAKLERNRNSYYDLESAVCEIPDLGDTEDYCVAIKRVVRECINLRTSLAAALARAEKAERWVQKADREWYDKLEAVESERDAALARAETAEARNLPAVGGSYVEGTLNGLAHRAQVHLGMEQENVLPDNALIAVLCDTVRLVREWERHTDAYVNCQLAAARSDAVREFAEWVAAQTPETECSESAVWLRPYPTDCEAYSTHGPVSDAHKGYLIHLARKEPTDG